MTHTQAAGAPWGARPEDWLRLSEHLGLQADLLPVVSNPHAKISPASKLRELGKTPSRYDAQGLAVGLPGWTKHQTSERDIGRWSQHSDLGICLQTRTVRAVDIDISDPVRARVVRDLIGMGLGVDLPVRRRPNSGKCLLALHMPGDFAKRVIRTADGIIEFLATGQQFIAIGTHPSGVRYEWDGGDLPNQVPQVTPAEFEVMWQALADAFALPDGDTRTRNGMVPVVPRAADDLRDPGVAWLDENGWVTGYQRDGRVDVRCPWEDGHSTDSGPTSTSYFPAGVGGFALGHFRCLHASCSGRTDAAFWAATGRSASEFSVVEHAADGGGDGPPLPAFVRARNGQIEATLGNVLMALRRPDVCGVRIGRDRFNDELMVASAGDGPPQWRLFGDDDAVVLREYLTKRAAGFKEIGRELIRDAVSLVGTENAFDSAQEWLARLPQWDGVPRVERFAERYLGVADGPYPRAVGRYLWTALAGRVLDPGCQADMALVLLGKQGAGKTRAVKALVPAPEHFVEINLAHRDDNLARSLRGKLVGELGELRGLAGRESEDIKAWISRRWEEWVPKYKEFATKFPRRLVLIGTSNEDQFLTDTTGNRRWLPLPVGGAGALDVDGIEADREQLWAEGAVMWQASGVQWQDAEALAREVHQDHMAVDSWTETVTQWLDTPDAMTGEKPRARRFLRVCDVLQEALHMDAKAVQRRDELRTGNVLRALGYERAKVWDNGAKVWRYRVPLGPLHDLA